MPNLCKWYTDVMPDTAEQICVTQGFSGFDALTCHLHPTGCAYNLRVGNMFQTYGTYIDTPIGNKAVMIAEVVNKGKATSCRIGVMWMCMIPTEEHYNWLKGAVWRVVSIKHRFEHVYAMRNAGIITAVYVGRADKLVHD